MVLIQLFDYELKILIVLIDGSISSQVAFVIFVLAIYMGHVDKIFVYSNSNYSYDIGEHLLYQEVC